MSNVTIPPEQWSKILGFLRECPNVYVGDEGSCKLFVEAVLWITRTGAQWRMLPAQYGKWNSIYVECFIGKMKHYRRIFSRFDKLDSRYLGFLQFAAVLIWLR